MIQTVRFRIPQTVDTVLGDPQTQLVKVPCNCKLVGGKIWLTGTSAGATIFVSKATINDGELSYLIPAWTPTPFKSGVAQSGYTVTVTATSEMLTKASGTTEKTPLTMNIGANAVLTAGYPPLSANDIVCVAVPAHVSQVPVFFIDLDFEI